MKRECGENSFSSTEGVRWGEVRWEERSIAGWLVLWRRRANPEACDCEVKVIQVHSQLRHWKPLTPSTFFPWVYFWQDFVTLTSLTRLYGILDVGSVEVGQTTGSADSEGLWSGTQAIFSALLLCYVTSPSHDCIIALTEVDLRYLLGLIGKSLSQLVVLLRERKPFLRSTLSRLSGLQSLKPWVTPWAVHLPLGEMMSPEVERIWLLF